MRATGALRGVLFVGGCVALAFGIAGVFLPILPATPFLLFAAYCFSKSHDGLHNWVLRNRLFGPLVRDWYEGRVIRIRVKVIALTFIAVGVATVWIKTPELFPGFRLIISAIMGGIATFIVTRPSRRI